MTQQLSDLRFYELPDWNVSLQPGAMVSLLGERGRFRYVSASVSASGEVSLTFVGGAAGHYKYKSVRPDCIRIIHRCK